MLNQSCILCKQYSRSIVCAICYRDCRRTIAANSVSQHPALIDLEHTIHADHLAVLSWYQWPLNSLLHLAKFKQRPGFLAMLSDWFVAGAAIHAPLPDALLAMPSNWLRWLQRGYNPTDILTLHLGKHLNLPRLPGYLRVGLQLRAQHQLTREQRLGRHFTFSCRQLPATLRHIALVDDVVTTGSTLKAAIRAIRDTNPQITVSVWCLGLTPL